MFALIKTCTADTAYAGCKALIEKCQRQMNYKLSPPLKWPGVSMSFSHFPECSPS